MHKPQCYIRNAYEVKKNEDKNKSKDMLKDLKARRILFHIKVLVINGMDGEGWFKAKEKGFTSTFGL